MILVREGPLPEGPRIEKIQSREVILKKKSSFQYGMKFSIENDIFIPGPSLATEKQGLGLKFSSENEIFKPRMKFQARMKTSCVGEWFDLDAAFLLTIGSFLLTMELFYLQLPILAFLLTIGAFLLIILASLLTVGAFLLTLGKCVS